MASKGFMVGMTIAGVLSLGAFVFILFFIDPDSYGMLAPVVFYASLFFTIASFSTLAGFSLRSKLSKNAVEHAHLAISFRQGLMFAGVLVTILFLKSQNLLEWWQALLVVVFVALAEFYFLSRKN